MNHTADLKLATSCGLSEDILDIKRVLYLMSYYVLLPVYFLVGMSGNIVLLVAFYKQSKTDSAYAYQVFLTTSKMLEIFFSAVFWWAYKWNAGVEGPGHSWYMDRYPLMFYAAHVGCPLANGFIVSSLLFSVAMTADRLFALERPFVYKRINHRFHQTVAAASCLFVGLSTSVFEVNRWRVVTTENATNGTSPAFSVRYDEAYLNTTTAMALGHTRTAVRLIGVGALIVLNVLVVITFRKRVRKVGQLAATSSEKKDGERKAADRALLMLTIYQSILMCLAQLPHSGYFIAAFVSASFGRCYGSVVAPVADACIQIADAADFFVIIGTNRRIRTVVLGFAPCCKRSRSIGDVRRAAAMLEVPNRYSAANVGGYRTRTPSPVTRKIKIRKPIVFDLQV